MAVNFDIFPIAGWESYAAIPKPRAPSKMCPKLSFIDDYKARRGEYYHHAIDIFASPGSHVLAVDGGTMWQHPKDPRGDYSYWQAGGWHAYLLSDKGHIYYYAHLLEKPTLKPGERVRAGHYIGQVGQSGNADKTCPHLHFATYVATKNGGKGRVVNPYQRLKETRSSASPTVRKMQPVGLALIFLLLAL